MHKYKFSTGTPEGTDAQLEYQHEKKFTEIEFQDMCEQCIVNAAKNETDDLTYRSCIAASPRYVSIDAEFKKLGFMDITEERIEYYLEPYFKLDEIRNKELIEMIKYQEPMEEVD